jgi:flagellar capping protein FliD
VEVDFDDTTGEVLGARILAPDGSSWNPDVAINNNVISGKFGYAEQGMTMTAVWDGQAGSGGIRTQTAEIRVRQGFVGRVIDSLEDILDEEVGTLATRQSHIDSQISVLDKNIEIQQERLEKQEERLKAKYARLEATLAQLDSMRGAFDALFTQLSSMQQSSNQN